MDAAKQYVALTGLENEAGVRVEAGELLPAEFVPAWQLDYWLAQRDIQVIGGADASTTPLSPSANRRRPKGATA